MTPVVDREAPRQIGRGTPWAGAVAIAAAELRLMIRNRAVAVLAVVAPLACGIYLALRDPDGDPAELAAIQLLVMITLCVYATATTTLAARRMDLFLKRLRSGVLGDGPILAGLLVPAVVIGCAQIGIAFGVLAWKVDNRPDNPVLLVVTTVASGLMCAGAAMATSAFTRSSEQAQVTTMPFLVVMVAGGGWVLGESVTDPTLVQRLVPGGAIAELVVGAWSGMAWSEAVPALAALAAWTAAGALVGLRLFRWEPRT